MTQTASWQDWLLAASLMVAVPFFVRHYLSGNRFSKPLYNSIIVVGLIFVSLGFGLNEFFLNALNVSRADDDYHHYMASEILMAIKYSNWDHVADYAALGNKSFHILLGTFYSLTNVGKVGAETFNCFLGFWAGLMLLRFFVAHLSNSVRVPNWILPLVFFPSLFFWTSILYKEALMYWSICLFFTSTVPASSGGKFQITLCSLTGFMMGMLLRPYSVVIWAVSVAMSIMIMSGRFLYVLMAVGIMIAAVTLAANQLEVERFAEAKEFADSWAARTSSQVGEGAGSAIEYGGSTIFGVSGAVSLFFRPFIWNVRALRIVMSSVEIWTITLLILFSWAFLDSKGLRLQLWRPDAIISIMVCLCYSVLFTYVANEGQIVRLRLSVMPAILTLAWLPLAHKLNKRSDLLGSHRPIQFVRS